MKKISENCLQTREPETDEVDASGTHRTASRKTKKVTPNEASLQNVLKSPECLDEAAITINFMARRLLSDMFEIPIFKDLLKSKVEMKMRELAVSLIDQRRTSRVIYFSDSGVDSQRSSCHVDRHGQHVSCDSQDRTDAMEYARHLVQPLSLLSRKFQVSPSSSM